MKTLLIIVNILISGSVMAQQLDRLLKEERFFELRDKLEQTEGLPKHKRLYYEAHVFNAFGKLEESTKAIGQINELYFKKFSKKQHVNLLLIKADNHTKQFEYAKSTKTLREILDKYSSRVAKKDKKDIRNTISLWGALSEVPRQKIHHNTLTEVPITHNKFNNWIIPVSNMKQDTIDFVFDTGANLSTIRKGIAEQMGVVYVGSKVDVGNSVGGNVKAEYGYIPSLSIGNLVVENMLVLIIPDEMLTFAEVNYTIHGIIGFPVIQGLGEFSIARDGQLRIATENSIVERQNLFTKGLMPFLQAFYNNEPLTMIFDTGAESSQLSHRYYNTHKRKVNANSDAGVSKIGGVGSVKEIKVRSVKGATFRVATHTLMIPKIDILKKTMFRDKQNDGFFGQDLLLQANEAVMNFRDMYLFFRD